MVTRLEVEIWSDVVCPWCYIGKRRFERALDSIRSGPEPVEVNVVYRAYQLDPTAPVGHSTPVTEAYAKKFGGPERARAIIDHVTRTAAEDGLEFRMDRAQRSNTLLAHRLLWWAGSRGEATQTALKESFLQAYFVDGGHVGDADLLAEIAAPILGCSIGEVRDFLASDRGVGEVNEELARAASHGITGVPTYVINGQWAIPGAQDSDTFERVLRRAAARATDT
jgi:predicted DsbA family dithiol-disulfide isomerase